jgi:hypothetical protein
VHTVLEFAREKPSMRLMTVTFRNIAQQDGVDAPLAHCDLADRSLCGKFLPISTQGKNSSSLTHEPRGIWLCTELVNVRRVGNPKPLRQQKVEKFS